MLAEKYPKLTRPFLAFRNAVSSATELYLLRIDGEYEV